MPDPIAQLAEHMPRVQGFKFWWDMAIFYFVSLDIPYVLPSNLIAINQYMTLVFSPVDQGKKKWLDEVNYYNRARPAVDMTFKQVQYSTSYIW